MESKLKTYDETEIAIKNLSKRQREVFEQLCIGFDKYHHPRTLESLVKKGLIIRTEKKVREGNFNFIDYHYYVSIPVHYVWCEMCAQEENIEEN